MKNKTINFKQKRYIMPLLFLPFIIFIGWQASQFIDNDNDTKKETQKKLSTSLGEVKDSIMSKNDAYNEFYKTRETRTMISNFEQEKDSVLYYTETLNDKQKRLIDSLDIQRKEKLKNAQLNDKNKSYYKPKTSKNKEIDENEKDFQRSLEIMKMLNNENKQSDNDKQEQQLTEDDPIKLMKQQMMFIDSIERARNPDFRKQQQAEQKLRSNKAKMDAFLNSTQMVTKQGTTNEFNHIAKKNVHTNLIKAVVDENIKGYLNSRIRIRLLEDVFVGDIKMPKGTFLYALISGFGLQRVHLNIISAMVEGEIIPINLSVYDNDGMKGLYVPRSAFREMIREIGSNTNYLQGSSMESGNQSFYTSLLSGVLNSASQTIANIIRSNKVRLKYNSYIFLINEKQLKNYQK